MADENFDPGERFAATQGLRGAYDGSSSFMPSSGGTDFGDTSWLDQGYGVENKTDYSIADLAKLFDRGGERLDMSTYGGLIENDSRPRDLNWLPGRENFRFGNLTGQALTDKLTDLYGDDGFSVYETRNQENPLKSQTVYLDDGNVIGSRNHTRSNGFLDKYGMTLGKMALSAGLGYAAAPLFAGAGATGGSGLVAGASGGGTGAGLSVGAATGGTGAGLGTGAMGAFGTSSGGLGAMFGGLGQAAYQSGVNTLIGGGNFQDFGRGFLANSIPGVNIPGGEVLNRTLRGAALGGLKGGTQGALMGAAGPLLNEGINQVGDYFNQWDQDSFGSGAMSTAPGQNGLQDYFKNFTGQPQGGPMSTTAQLQNLGGGQGANQLDWESILGGTQGFGNPDAQGQAPDMQASSFGIGGFDQPMDFQNGVPGFTSNAPAATPDIGSDWDEGTLKFARNLPDGLKAFLIAQNPKYASLFGQQQKMNPLQAAGGALGTLFAYNRANKDLNQAQKALAPMGQNSAYMKALRQQVERKDAAAGRRSQYGPREVELQAKLAEMNGRNAPYLAQLAGAKSNNRVGMIGQLLGYADRSGLDDYALKGLQDLFKG